MSPRMGGYVPADHKTRHQAGGRDEISIASLSGTPATLTTHEADIDAHHKKTDGLWFRIFTGAGGADAWTAGHHFGFRIDAEAEYVRGQVIVPHDYVSGAVVTLVCLALATATHRLNVETDFAADNEAYNTHTDSALDVDTAMTANRIHEVDISAAFTSLAAGDIVGVKISGDATNVPNLIAIGIKFRYS